MTLYQEIWALSNIPTEDEIRYRNEVQQVLIQLLEKIETLEQGETK